MLINPYQKRIEYTRGESTLMVKNNGANTRGASARGANTRSRKFGGEYTRSEYTRGEYTRGEYTGNQDQYYKYYSEVLLSKGSYVAPVISLSIERYGLPSFSN